jgi:glycosyltransferase involved in cell wall biosynthesis
MKSTELAMDLPLISVIIPAYNAEAFIERTLNSVLAQTYQNLEVIVIDDGSGDRTPQIVEAIAERDRRVRLLQQFNAGVAAARNLGIEQAKGEFIAPIDADDIWYPQNIERQAQLMLSSSSEIGLVYSWSVDIDEDDRLTGVCRAAQIQGNVYLTLICHNFLGNASASLIRRVCFEKVGGYNCRLKEQNAQGCEDWDLYLRIAEYYKFRVVPSFLIGYRKIHNSMSSDYSQMAQSHRLMLQAVRQKHLKIPTVLFSLSSSSFYIYLARQCDQSNDYQDVLHWLYQALKVDPITPLFRYGLYSLFLKSLLGIIFQNLHRQPNNSVDLTSILLLSKKANRKFLDPSMTNKNTFSLRFKLFVGSLLHQLLSIYKISLNISRSRQNPPMLYPIKVINIELSHPLKTIDGLEGYMKLQGLVRLHGVPIGYIQAPITNGHCKAETISKLILEEHSWKIIQTLLKNRLAASPKPEGFRLEELFDVPLPEYKGELPLVTVAVCTRDRASDLAICLEALCCLDYPKLDLLVVDNAPTNEATKELVSQYPQVRYTCEPRPGLDWARNQAIFEAKGEIIAYTDDDVVVDPGWVKALAQVFAENHEVMAVTGLVVPYELETESQVLFELYGGFGRGFERKWNRVEKGNKMPWGLLGTGQFGTGANMAYRRSVFSQIGYFDPAMDVGTVTNGGGDLEMYFRILKEGHTLVYEPRALVQHRHRQNYERLRTQITNNGIGLYSYFTCGILRYPEELFNFLSFGVYWLMSWHFRRLLISFIHPFRFPRDLLLAELQGFFQSFGRYQTARQKAEAIAASFGELSLPLTSKVIDLGQNNETPRKPGVAVQTVELSEPLQPLTDAAAYSQVRVVVTWQSQPIGIICIRNTYQPISQNRLIEEIVNGLELQIFQVQYNLSKDLCWSNLLRTITQRWDFKPIEKRLLEKLPQEVSISIVISTYDRPAELYRCLTHLVEQTAHRPVQILVVDNHPSSGLIFPVVEKFPNALLLHEPHRGSSYARNRGILASTGEIIVMLDDDIIVSKTWLENLLSPFTRHDVMAVTGNLLPLELETVAQRWFEIYGGIGCGFDPFEVNGDWFESSHYRTAPTWNCGTLANAAFRASIFSQSKIGLLDESLGIGTPAGSGDDLYLFYKLLKAGHTLIYQPSAYVWHQHYREMSDFLRQIFNYGKGHVAYQINTLVRDGDLRVLARLLVGLPLQHWRRIYYRLRGWNCYPIWLTLLELSGNLVGPLALLQSRCRTLFLGRGQSSALALSNVPQLTADGVAKDTTDLKLTIK